MRTTLDLNDELLRQAKKRADRDGVSLRDLVEEGLRLALKRKPAKSRYRLQWRAERGRLLPGVKLEDRDTLSEVMEPRS